MNAIVQSGNILINVSYPEAETKVKYDTHAGRHIGWTLCCVINLQYSTVTVCAGTLLIYS